MSTPPMYIPGVDKENFTLLYFKNPKNLLQHEVLLRNHLNLVYCTNAGLICIIIKFALRL